MLFAHLAAESFKSKNEQRTRLLSKRDKAADIHSTHRDVDCFYCLRSWCHIWDEILQLKHCGVLLLCAQEKTFTTHRLFALTCFIRSARAICIPSLNLLGLQAKSSERWQKRLHKVKGKRLHCSYMPTLTQQLESISKVFCDLRIRVFGTLAVSLHHFSSNRRWGSKGCKNRVTRS